MFSLKFARSVAGYKWLCAYVDPVISVRVLCLFHNNESGLTCIYC